MYSDTNNEYMHNTPSLPISHLLLLGECIMEVDGCPGLDSVGVQAAAEVASQKGSGGTERSV